MVKRYAPCHKYFDQWDETGSSACEEAREGDWVKYKTFVDTTNQLRAQNAKLKKHIAGLQAALKTANANAAPAAPTTETIYE